MRTYDGRVAEMQLDPAGETSAWIACPPEAVPGPGQYLLAWSPADMDATLAAPLFPAQYNPGGFLAAAPIPAFWEPSTALALRGPLGRGFDPPLTARRLALAALGESAARLLPLIPAALGMDAALALFADCPLPLLPSDIEVYPLEALPESLSWADFLALDLNLATLTEVREVLGLEMGQGLPCPAQALVLAPMPCGGAAECGVCAVPAHRSWRLACVEGPVFDLNELMW